MNHKTNARYPTGTVSFLFTDIEGSTKLAQKYPDRWDDLMARHNVILRAEIESHNGYVFQVIGDAFCAAFQDTEDAVRAAAAAQTALYSESWDESIVKVRMAIHTGSADIQENGDYHGYLTLSRVQRLMSAGHGGQVLISQAARNLVEANLPERISMRNMGEHRLKDLAQPERIHQLIITGLSADFPPLKTLDTYRHNLPAQATSFVGREKETKEVREAIIAHRLVTLTGSGGTGKTRLSLQATADLLDHFPDGVWLIELASVSEPALLPGTAANVLRLRVEDSRPPMDVMVDWLRDRRILIILDNCEHLIDACAQFANIILQRCREAHILATSREALGIAGEAAYRVPSLPTPNEPMDIQQLEMFDSVRLFVQRATLTRPTFRLTDENASSVAQICRRLDGIPLAIELASAQLGNINLEDVLARLGSFLDLADPRGARHSTLRAAIQWSYDLLNPVERLLFNRLSVFAGGWGLQEAVMVAAGYANAAEPLSSSSGLELDPLPVTGGMVTRLTLENLTRKALIQARHTEAGLRYDMLDTIRELAREKQNQSNEMGSLARRHLAYFLDLSEQLEPQLWGAEQMSRADLLERDLPNLRAALDWAAEFEPELGLRLAVALCRFWLLHGDFEEAGVRLEALLAKPPTRASNTLAQAWYWRGDFAYRRNNLEEAGSASATSLHFFQELGDTAGQARAWRGMGMAAWLKNDYKNAVAACGQSLSLYRELGDRRGMAYAINILAEAARMEKRFDDALAYNRETLEIMRELGDRRAQGIATLNLGLLEVESGDALQGEQSLKKAGRIFLEVGEKQHFTYVFIGLGRACQLAGDLREAARWYGVLHSYSAATNMRLFAPDLVEHEQNLEALRGGLSAEEFDKAWHTGENTSVEEAIRSASA